jgi:hypothetical protein
MPSLDIPNDADGDAMRRIIADGADPTRPMKIDFQIDCPDIASARKIATRVPPGEFAVDTYSHDESSGATCECSRHMLLEHSELLRIQRELTEIAKPFGGYCEAWGTFGNTPNA